MLQLLLKFMTVGPPDDVDIASLYHNAVIASCFVSSAGDVGPIELNYEPIRSPDGLPLLLPESSSSSRSTAGGGGESKQLDDSVVLLRIILQHLHSAISDHNRREQAGLLWNTFKKVRTKNKCCKQLKKGGMTLSSTTGPRSTPTSAGNCTSWMPPMREGSTSGAPCGSRQSSSRLCTTGSRQRRQTRQSLSNCSF